jgi:hypothetical protein
MRGSGPLYAITLLVEETVLKRTVIHTSLLSVLIIVFGFATVTLSLAGCSPDGTVDAGQPVAEAVELEPAAVDAAPTEEATGTPIALVPTVEPLEPDTCTDCHTDKDLLIDTADPEEEVISENEGEG